MVHDDDPRLRVRGLRARVCWFAWRLWFAGDLLWWIVRGTPDDRSARP